MIHENFSEISHLCNMKTCRILILMFGTLIFAGLLNDSYAQTAIKDKSKGNGKSGNTTTTASSNTSRLKPAVAEPLAGAKELKSVPPASSNNRKMDIQNPR